MSGLRLPTELFPMPLLFRPPNKSRSRRCKARYNRSVAIFQRVNSCISCLNEMAGCVIPSKALLRSEVPSKFNSVLDHLFSSTLRFCRRLDESNLSSGDLTSLLFAHTNIWQDVPPATYDLSYVPRQSDNAVPLIADSVALPSTCTVAKVPLLDLLPPDLAKQYASPDLVVQRTCLPRTFPALPFCTTRGGS